MRVCRFCSAENEDWMQICQECGNPIIDSSVEDNNEEENNDYGYDTAVDMPNFTGLKLTILILSVILVILLIYTMFVVFF